MDSSDIAAVFFLVIGILAIVSVDIAADITEDNYQKAAIQHNVAYWAIDPMTGETSFEWIEVAE